MGRERDRDDELDVTSRELRDQGRVPDADLVVANEPPVRTHREARSEADGERQIELPEALNLAHDRVRWGPIWAGLLTALTSLVLLSVLGLAIGLTTVNAGAAAARGGPPPETGLVAAIWGALSALVSFLLGGYVAGRTAAVFDRGWGAFNGAMVFLLAVPVTLLLAGMGLGTVLGALGAFVSGLDINPAAVPNPANQAGPSDVARAAEALRGGAWGTLLGLLIGLGASALGGMLGTRREVDLDRATGQITRQ